MLARLLLAAALSLAALPAAAQDYVAGVDRDPAYNIGPGTDLVMAYFGSTTCFACQQPAFKAAAERAKVLLAEHAAAEGKTFVALGVSLDPGVAAGLEFIASAGAFDEVAVGRNWFNSAALAHLFRPEGLDERPLSQPSIIVFERDMVMGETIAVGAVRYRFEIAGGDAIPAWVAAGAPLD